MDTKEFKEVIEEIVDVKLNKKGITKYVSAIVSSINPSDNTINVYLPPDDKNIITGLLNKTGVNLNIGDSVELCTKNGKIKNAWVALRHGDNFVAGGGGVSIPIQDNPPANPQENDLWINSSPNTNINLVRDTIPFDSIIEYDGDTVPDGYEEIEMSGNNANGSWFKDEDGNMICYKTYSGSVDISTAWGSLYEQAIDMGTLPAEFINTPKIIASPGDGSGIMIEQTGVNASSLSWGRTTVVRPVSGTVQVKINLIAIGRWK